MKGSDAEAPTNFLLELEQSEPIQNLGMVTDLYVPATGEYLKEATASLTEDEDLEEDETIKAMIGKTESLEYEEDVPLEFGSDEKLDFLRDMNQLALSSDLEKG
mmetsp:Transcript_16914/g.28637  ORF Transcript_16914/g.28637 Transcript_16914/m.28637 type:complete len:104 (-) Transcript_16914:224-535(-)